MRRISLISLLLALTMLLLTIPTAAANSGWLVEKERTYDDRFEDDNVWCGDAIRTVYEAGLLEGLTTDRFNAAAPLTRAQIIVITSRLLDRLQGGDGDFPAPAEGQVWYQVHYDFLCETLEDPHFTQMGTGEPFAWTADTPCQRGSFAILLAGALDAAEITLPVLNDIAPPPDVNRPEIFSLYQAGVLNGTDAYGSFSSGDLLDRGQAAAMLARLVDPAQRLTFTLRPFDQCRDLLQLAPDTVLLTGDGIAVTADQFANHLCVQLRRQHDRLLTDGPARNDLAQALRDACADMQEELALEQLAAELGLPVTVENVPLPGYQGMSEAALTQWARCKLLKETLAGLQTTPLPLSPTPALRSLDPAAVQQRLAAGPSYIGYYSLK